MKKLPPVKKTEAEGRLPVFGGSLEAERKSSIFLHTDISVYEERRHGTGRNVAHFR